MNKKLLAVFALVVVVAAGASAQIMFGITGALPMDTKLSAEEIQDRFESGQGIWYGGFGEIAFGRLGFGISVNTTAPYDGGFGSDMVDLDVLGYLSYHVFRARSFLDPFLELGAGYIGTDYADSDLDPNEEAPVAANLYWYGAFGLGVNLGPIGVFGKFAYNNKIDRPMTFDDGMGGEVEVPGYGYWYWDGFAWQVERYVPKFRFTLGAKLIL